MLNINLKCARCGEEFTVNTVQYKSLGFHQLPKSCPHCNDLRQKKNAKKTVIRRECLEEWDRVSIVLPADWFFEFQAESFDRGCRRAVVKGSIGQGKSWHGRIDIYDFRWNQEGLGHVRLMEVEHEYAEGKDYLPEYQYLSIDPVDGGTFDEHAPDYALIFANVHYKTTLKGFGRQFTAGLETCNAVWAYRLSSQAKKTGRFGNEMCVAIVDDANYVQGKVRGDINQSTAWTLSYPGGVELENLMV